MRQLQHGTAQRARKAEDPSTVIRDLFARDPVCVAIVSYLFVNNLAADTAQGIADWWIDREVNATEAALETLAAHGIVRRHRIQTSLVYTFTKNARLRAAVRESLNGLRHTCLAEGPVNDHA
jgi:hypothetical protein